MPVDIAALRELVEKATRIVDYTTGWDRPTADLIRALPALLDEVERMRELSARMAEDGGLWFVAETAAEAYLQQELRKLCAAIEGRSPEECARAALKEMKA